MDKVMLSMSFLALLPMYAVSFMISSWVNEHEADCYAVAKAGFKPIIQALAKLNIYNSLKGCETMISDIRFSDVLKCDRISYSHVLGGVIRRIFVYLHPQSIINRPLPDTHPPLILRLYRIKSSVQNINKTDSKTSTHQDNISNQHSNSRMNR